MLTEKLQLAYKKIKEADQILLLTHERPDGDALAATCALAEFMDIAGKKASVFCWDKPPAQFSFLPGIEKFSADKFELNFSQFDLIIVLDCGQLSRTKLTEEISRRRQNQFVIEFDHHSKVEDYADLEIRDPGMSSTAELIYDFFKTNKIKLTKNLASCILTGIMTDTGNLLYPSTSNATIQAASEMLLYGARFPQILENTWRNKSLGAMRVWGEAMSNLEINKKYNFAFTVITRKTMKESNATDEELEGAAGFISSLDGVKGLLVLREEENNKIKGSFRTSDPNVDVSKLARALGGGGHMKAAGFVIDGQLEETKNGWRIT